MQPTGSHRFFGTHSNLIQALHVRSGSMLPTRTLQVRPGVHRSEQRHNTLLKGRSRDQGITSGW